MTLTYYETPPMRADEAVREAAVLASGALELMGDPVLARIADETRRAVRTQMAAITIIHSDWQYLIAAAGLPPGVDSRRTSFCGHAVANEDALFVVPDARHDHRFAGNPVVTEGPRVRFYAAASLIDHGQPIGVLCVFDPRKRDSLDITERAALRRGAEQAVARIRERRLARGVPEITARQRATLDLRGVAL